MTKDRLNELQDLKRAVEAAIAYSEAGMMRDMSPEQKQKWKEEFGEFDFVIGQFAIVNLNKP